MISAPPVMRHSSSQDASARSPMSCGGGWAGPTVILSSYTCQRCCPSHAIVVGPRSTWCWWSIWYRPGWPTRSADTVCMTAALCSVSASTSSPSPPKPVRRTDSGTCDSIAETSHHSCSVASNAAVPLSCSSCSTSSLTSGPVGRPSGAISGAGSSCGMAASGSSGCASARARRVVEHHPRAAERFCQRDALGGGREYTVIVAKLHHHIEVFSAGVSGALAA